MVPPLPVADFEINGDHFALDNPAIGLTDDHGGILKTGSI
jgi:hypothetical protein